MFKRFLSLILALVIVSAPLFGGAGMVSAANTDISATIEKQIRAFADSIDKSNADDSAALSLAMHGITGRGKKLSVGKSHALTATLFNSELLQACLTDVCTRMIDTSQRLNMQSQYAFGDCSWNGKEHYLAGYPDERMDANERIFATDWIRFSGQLNSYDNSLEWMAGSTAVGVKLERITIKANALQYNVTVTVKDRFDFSVGDNGSIPKEIASILGSFLFKEFDWESIVSFQLEVPNACTHTSENYHWTYDPGSHSVTSEVSGEFAGNDGHQMISLIGGSPKYYHRLDKTVYLLHDRPWELEYSIQGFCQFVLSSKENSANLDPVLFHVGGNYMFAGTFEIIRETNQARYIRHLYGINFQSKFANYESHTYTYRFKNVIAEDNSNMIYLSVYDNDLKKTVLPSTPMNQYYTMENGVMTNHKQTVDWINGRDFLINYIGDANYTLNDCAFDLTVWENGEGVESASYCKTKVTKPTCTAQGYTTYTCSCCGYSYQADKVKAKGHSYGDWTVLTAPTCTEAGEEQRKCKSCDHFETREITATGHNYENYVCTNCGELEYIPGDVDTNGTVDVDDVLALLWHVLFPEEYPIEVDADFDTNRVTDVDDVLKLLWFVLFPEEYPLN